MNLYDYSNNPLYTDRALDNPQWSKVLFGSRPLQASELIEIQTIQQKSLHRSLSTLYKNGSVIKGLNPVIKDMGDNLEVYVTPGLFYIEGFSVQVEGRTFVISKEGLQSFYIKLEERIITEDDDPTLRDTNTGGELYGVAGAARLLWLATVELNDVTPYPLFQVVDGDLIKSREVKERDLAIYERYGNFVVEGLSTTAVVDEVQTLPDPVLAEVNKYREELTLLTGQERRQRSILLSMRAELDYLNSLSKPNHLNLKRIEDLPAVIEDQQAKVETLLNQILNLEADLYRYSVNHSNSHITLPTFSKTLRVNPGVAYVNGLRTEKTNVTSVKVPHELEEVEVYALPFTYTKNRPFNTRTLNYGSQIKNLRELLYIGFTLYLNFSNLVWGPDALTVRVSITYDELNELETLDALALDVVEKLNSTEQIDDRVTYSTTFSSDLNPYLLRSILQQNIKAHKSGPSNLSFESYTSNDIRVETKSSNTLVRFDKQVTLINHLYSNQERTYYLKGDIKSISSVAGLKKEIEYPVVRGKYRKGSDDLPDDSIASILKIRQGDVTYVEGKDYYLSGNKVHWNIEDEESYEPDPGTTYYVTFLYTKPFKDYELEDGFLRFSSDEPEDGTVFYVTYVYLEPLKTHLFLKENGDLVVSKSSPNSLLLADLTFTSNSVEVENVANRRWTSQEIEILRDEIQRNKDSIRLLRESIEHHKDPSFYLLGKVDIDHSKSTAGWNRSAQAYSKPLDKVDLDLGNERLILDYTISEYKVENEATNYIDVSPISRDKGLLKVEPSVLLNNGISLRSYPHIDSGKDSWYIESEANDYLDKDYPVISYELAQGLSTQNEEVSSKQRLTLSAIGLPPRTSGFLIYVDNQVVRRSQYILAPDSIAVGSIISTDDEGHINISVEVDLSPGTHLVEIKSKDYACSSYVSVMDTYKLVDYVSCAKDWDRQLRIDYKELPNYPANRISEVIPSVLQEFEVEDDILLYSIAVAVKSGEADLVVGKSDTRGPTPTVLARGEYSRDISGLRYYILEEPIYLKKGDRYYFGFLHHRDISLYISRNGELSTESSLEVNREVKHSVLLTDGYLGHPIEGATLVYTLNNLAFKEERLIELGSYSTDRDIEAFSVNYRPITPNNTEVTLYYRKDNNLIRIEPFTLVKSIDLQSVELVARLRGVINTSPILDLRGSSISLYKKPLLSQELRLQSQPLPIETDFSSVIVRVEHLSTGIDLVAVSTDGLLDWVGCNLLSTENQGDVLVSKYECSLTNKTGHLYYRLSSSSGVLIRGVRISVK